MDLDAAQSTFVRSIEDIPDRQPSRIQCVKHLRAYVWAGGCGRAQGGAGSSG